MRKFTGGEIGGTGGWRERGGGKDVGRAEIHGGDGLAVQRKRASQIHVDR